MIQSVRVNAKAADGKNIHPQRALQLIGPMVQIVISPISLGGNPVAGFALIDTGAKFSCVDRKIADGASLPVVDSGPMTSATHQDEIVPIYSAKLTIANFGAFTCKRAYGANLSSIMKAAQPTGNGVGSVKLIALIGRDALESMMFVYNGSDGSFSICR